MSLMFSQAQAKTHSVIIYKLISLLTGTQNEPKVPGHSFISETKKNEITPFKINE